MERYSYCRLSSDEKNLQKIESFTNTMNDNLALYLKELAWDDDSCGENAVYIVVDNNNDGEVAAFFGIKSGMLISPFSEKIYKSLQQVEVGNTMEFSEDKLSDLEYIHNFVLAAENSTDIDKVAMTRPGIELSHLCINTNYRQKMLAEGEDTSGIGNYIFHSLIYPLVDKVKEQIGCQFLYLFAADSSENGSLIKYYKEVLGFITLEDYDKKLTNDDDIIPIMPMYDYQCKFMLMPLY